MGHETQNGKAGVASSEAWSAGEKAAILAQLDRLLASVPMRNAVRQQRLLRYIVEATLAGARDRLKAFTLGVEVFDRGSDFDPNVDSIVRVEAGRLRAKLMEYYVGEGAGDPVVIDLPKGSYAARIAFVVLRPETRAESPTAGLAERDRPSIAVIPSPTCRAIANRSILPTASRRT
jgi:adenylate cyclase